MNQIAPTPAFPSPSLTGGSWTTGVTVMPSVPTWNVKVTLNQNRPTQTVVVYTPQGMKMLEAEADYLGNVVEFTYPTKAPQPTAESLVLTDKDGVRVGQLTWKDGVVDFEGDESESAKSLFHMVQAYVEAAREDSRGSH